MNSETINLIPSQEDSKSLKNKHHASLRMDTYGNRGRVVRLLDFIFATV